jgi:hypothetical protein
VSVAEPSDDDRVWITAADDAYRQACDGWQCTRRCVDDHGTRLLHPHPACLRAQYLHDLILLEHGLL